jgi:hypothetical protein
LVIGGYVPGTSGLDCIVVAYYADCHLFDFDGFGRVRGRDRWKCLRVARPDNFNQLRMLLKKVAELSQARNELEMKVAERTADLQRSEAYFIYSNATAITTASAASKSRTDGACGHQGIYNYL